MWCSARETADLSDYRAEFLTGREACRWIVDTLNGPEPAAIWGLSDGDVAWWCYDALAKLPDVDRQWLDKLAGTDKEKTDLRHWAESDRREIRFVAHKSKETELRERADRRDKKADSLEAEIAKLRKQIDQLDEEEKRIRSQMLKP